MAHVGDRPPEGEQRWWLAGTVERAFVTIEYPARVTPGTTVWLRAAWCGRRADHGPWSEPVMVMISEASPALSNVRGLIAA